MDLTQRQALRKMALAFKSRDKTGGIRWIRTYNTIGMGDARSLYENVEQLISADDDVEAIEVEFKKKLDDVLLPTTPAQRSSRRDMAARAGAAWLAHKLTDLTQEFDEAFEDFYLDGTIEMKDQGSDNVAGTLHPTDVETWSYQQGSS